jgi:hypothetical protein
LNLVDQISSLPASERRWRLHCGLTVGLIDPLGDPVTLPYSKLGELLRALARAPEGFMSRRALGSLLWPDSSHVQRQGNVRQALHRLRGIVGSEVIEATADRCRLSSNVLVERDCGVLQDREGHAPPHVDRSVAPIRGFYQFLLWCAENDPFQMFDLMRSNIDVCLGISTDELRHLLRLASSRPLVSRLVSGWRHFWSGHVELGLSVDSSLSHFKSAQEIGMELSDHLLAAEAIHWLTAGKILAGQIDAAARVAAAGLDYGERLQNRELKARLQHAMGTVLLHQGLPREAIAFFERANPAFERRILDWAQNEALRALYEACSGNAQIAEIRLAEPKRIGLEAGHGRLNGICILTDGYIALANRDFDFAHKKFGEIPAAEGLRGHFETYAREGEAVALTGMGEAPEAWKAMSAARTYRKHMRLAYTAWDRSRLEPFAAS